MISAEPGVDISRDKRLTSPSLAKDTLFMLGARLIFVVSGYLVHIRLGRSLGPVEYGAFGVVLSTITFLEIFIMRGLRDSLAKYVSEFPGLAAVIKKKAMRIQIGASIVLTAAYYGAAQPLSVLLGDPTLLPYLRLSAALIPGMSLYNFYSGYLSGKRAFGQRSVLLSLHSLGKIIAVIVFILLGWGVRGALAGYLCAALLGTVIGGIFSSERSRPEGDFATSKIMFLVFPLGLYSGLTTLLMTIDLFLVKKLVLDRTAAGFYTSAGMIAGVPLQIFIAFSITIFPAISQATAFRDDARARMYISGSLKYLLLFLVPISAFISGASPQILAMIYSREYRPASGALSILIFGIALLVVFHFLSAIISGSGRPRIPMALAMVLIPLDILLNVAFIRSSGLKGAALATTLTCLLGVMGAGFYVRKRFGVLIGSASFFKIMSCSLILFIIPVIFPLRGALVIPCGIALFLVYLLVLIALDELDLGQLRQFLSLGIRRPPGDG